MGSAILMTSIPLEEIRFHPTSFCDNNGRVFTWNGGLYRGLNAQGAALYQRMHREGIVERLVAKKLLIETEVADLSVPGFDLVLKHRRLPFVTHPFEWSPRMLQAAALAIADLEIELIPHGLTTGGFDTNCWNLLFDGGTPLYVDFGSIEPLSVRSPEDFSGFEMSCLFPLRLHAAGRGRIAWRLLQDFLSGGILHADYAALNGVQQQPVAHVARKLRRRLRALVPDVLYQKIRPERPVLAPETNRLATMRRLRDEAAAIKMPPEPMPSNRVSPHATQIEAVLARESLKTVLTVGDGGSAIAALAGGARRQVVAMAREHAAVDAQFQAAEKGVLPVWMDIRYPTPGFGISGHELQPATERLACDAVVATGCVHRLAFENRLPVEHIAAIFSDFAKKVLVVEFSFPESPLLRECACHKFPWYGLDNFVAGLGQRFATVEILESGPESALLIARKPS